MDYSLPMKFFPDKANLLSEFFVQSFLMEKIYQQLETFLSLSNLSPSTNDFNGLVLKYLNSLHEILSFNYSDFFDYLMKTFSKGSKNEILSLITMFWCVSKDIKEENANKLKELCLLYFKDQHEKGEMFLSQKHGKKLNRLKSSLLYFITNSNINNFIT